MLQNPSLPVAGDGGSVSAGLEEEEEEEEEEERAGLEQGYRNWSGNSRWPSPETTALLKIRSDMEKEFKVASPKLPLWDEVSRKMGAAGYVRDAKKCKEKFENIYKYYKRTKDSLGAQSGSKQYKFFEQLEALEHHQHPEHFPPAYQVHAATGAATAKDGDLNVILSPSMQQQLSSLIDESTPVTSCSSKESEGTHKKKRKVSEFFGNLMKQVIDKQEDLHTKFVEVLDKYERERMAREDAWKMHELVRIERERELLAQERSIAAAKDAAILAFLQKFSEQGTSMDFSGQKGSFQTLNQAFSVQFPMQACSVQIPNQSSSVQFQMPANSPVGNTISNEPKKNEDWELVRRNFETPLPNNGRTRTPISSTRWPREEVQDLIRLRSNYDMQYQENGAKGHLWEEIAVSMKKLGYERNAKRCKEKWENINKYYRRLKDSNKKRPEDSKTCVYVQMLDALYNRRYGKGENQADKIYDLRPEELLMHIMSGQEPESTTQNGHSQSDEKIQGYNGSGVQVGDVAGDGYRIVAPMEQDSPSVAFMS